MPEVRFMVPGAPRTKKNSGSVKTLTIKGKRRKIHMPSEAWLTWRDIVMLHKARILDEIRRQAGVPRTWQPPIAWDVNCRALFYRDANRGDAVGYYQGLADVLQEIGVVKDDVFIVSWDGSRMLKSATAPHVEVVLEWDGPVLLRNPFEEPKHMAFDAITRVA